MMIFFGDSHTEKETNEDGSPRLTAGIQESFPGWNIRNAGIFGHTTRDALGRIERDVLRHDPKRVIVWFGSNDASRSRDVSLDEYEANLQKIANMISPPKVLFVTPPPVVEASQAPRRDNVTLAAYSAAVKRVARQTGTAYYDLFDVARKEPRFDQYLLEDGLHFNPQGYVWLVERFTEALTEWLMRNG